MYCAKEDDLCECNGIFTIGRRYGKGKPGSGMQQDELPCSEMHDRPYNEGQIQGKMVCNTAAFGDPDPGYILHCCCFPDPWG